MGHIGYAAAQGLDRLPRLMRRATSQPPAATRTIPARARPTRTTLELSSPPGTGVGASVAAGVAGRLGGAGDVVGSRVGDGDGLTLGPALGLDAGVSLGTGPKLGTGLPPAEGGGTTA